MSAMDHYIPDVRAVAPATFMAADPWPGYWDRFGNVVARGSWVILARSGGGTPALGRIEEVWPNPVGGYSWPIVTWRSWDQRWDREAGAWVYSWGPVRSISPAATVAYFGKTPGQAA